MISPLTLGIIFILSMMLLVVPKRYFLLPFMLAACFVPTDQRFIVAGLDFTVLRMLVIVGALRIAGSGGSQPIAWTKYDKLLITWITVGAIVYAVRLHTVGAVINRLGVLFDVLGLYWIFRQNLRSLSDVKRVFYMLAFCALALSPLVALEWVRGDNPFSILGRVNTVMRGDRYRCQAAFPHSIILGLFFATLVPAFIALARLDNKKGLFYSATAASIFIVLATASSTPLGGLIAIFAFLAIYRYRSHGVLIMKGLIAMLSVLHFVREQPVWHLLARVNIIGGSTGWHRYKLIDQAINHAPEWLLFGCNGTAHWGYGMRDLANQYVLEGVRGGLVTLILFIILLITSVRTMNRMSQQRVSPGLQYFFWSIAVMIIGHSVSFLGVSYFGQILMLLYLNFAIIGFFYKHSFKPVSAADQATAIRSKSGAKARVRIGGKQVKARARRRLVRSLGHS